MCGDERVAILAVVLTLGVVLLGTVLTATTKIVLDQRRHDKKKTKGDGGWTPPRPPWRTTMSDWTEDLDEAEREVLTAALHARRVWLEHRIRIETHRRWRVHYEQQRQVCRSLIDDLEGDGDE
jgi:hypothetical protein